MVTILRGDHIITNPDGTVEVSILMNGQTFSKVFQDLAHVQDFATPVASPDQAMALVLASWMGVDPTLGNADQFTQYDVEVDFSQVQAIRRVTAL